MRILLTAFGTHGDHLPLVALALGLREHGHALRIAVGPEDATTFDGEGFTVKACGPGLPTATMRAQPWLFDLRLPRPPDAAVRAADLEDMPRHYRELASLVRVERPDLIVTGFRQRAAVLVAEDYDLPCVTVCLRRGALRGMRLDANPRHLVLLASSARFDDTEIDPRVAVCGFLFHEPRAQGREPSDALLHFLGAGPFVALLPGSTPITQATAYVRHHLDAAEALGLRLVVQRTTALEELDVAAPHAFFAESLPHDWLLARAAAVITPGRVGVVARALRAGCPILAEPRTRDDHDHARRLLALGVGAALDPHVLDATSVRRMLAERVLLPQVRERCAALAAGIAAEDGTQTAVHSIERWARGHYPPGN